MHLFLKGWMRQSPPDGLVVSGLAILKKNFFESVHFGFHGNGYWHLERALSRTDRTDRTDGTGGTGGTGGTA
jgi:hypothetical protein